MSIFNHFQNITLTNDQRKAVEKIESFIHGSDNIFILKGFAGTGKTTLIKGLVNYLEETKKAYDVMAPTGRASKILRDKTGCGQTIHRSIYNFDRLEPIKKSKEENDYSFKYYFPLYINDKENQIIIVDEASMISSKESKNELFSFGTNVLLDDLITYSKLPDTSNKIIFVGDPAQLPPVGDNKSKALDKDYLAQMGMRVDTFQLEEVVRQKENTILKNAFKIRSLVKNNNKENLEFEYDSSFIEINSYDIPHKFAEMFPNPEIDKSVIIAFSNQQCLNYNLSIRSKIFPGQKNVQIGDILIINHNNYHTYGVELMNGEMVKVVDVATETISRKNIPVYETINGKRVKKYISLTFRKIKIRLPNSKNDISCLIIDSLLNSPNRDLSISEMKALFIDFNLRFDIEQKQREKNGLHRIKKFKEEYFIKLRKDQFFNALRVKYGYAITCHKAQGGEWDTVFIDYYGRTSLKDDPLRWSYTATTRSKNVCQVANAPNFTKFSYFIINSISTISNIPPNTLSLKNVSLSPYHTEQQHRAKSLKFLEINEKLKNTAFVIKDVVSLGSYRERYTIAYDDYEIDIEADHKSSGHFNDFVVVNEYTDFPTLNELLEIVNSDYEIKYNIDYQPSIPLLKELYSIMQMASEDAEVIITNVEEKPENYFVNYYLKTDAKFAMIQFYFNNKQQLTRALPKSLLGNEDKKLTELIKNLRKYVI